MDYHGTVGKSPKKVEGFADKSTPVSHLLLGDSHFLPLLLPFFLYLGE